MTRPLEGLGYHALVLVAVSGFNRGQNFGVRAHEPAQKLDVLVINAGNFFLTEDAIFFDLLGDSHI
ncbi:MAG: hypothetical protein A3E98_02655 [Candidatus Doudnabacteria bacterium RIFCSPHIGHO2_12_FULL_48_11]|uniref:Uncharacterized protein n=1 Tax=Candidatus Doudnabacteria bacterium RIFCSPHIGHO2_01_FULL_46_24 TaxID=1817825 RepID=A0A1F5NT88_9BACT|nr:MAG: hypothetical protein A2720_04295 [Candidatus Doudnabacteria bacterium RIFCSPHIGHO2_01_FULL_46_24]OGE94132.1 MAG: hypothetical protein A3E98_02655 [Candidatus Doudnabacteria bacterium RIFCSPHIGHO2_12_FULL_48_11]